MCVYIYICVYIIYMMWLCRTFECMHDIHVCIYIYIYIYIYIGIHVYVDVAVQGVCAFVSSLWYIIQVYIGICR